MRKSAVFGGAFAAALVSLVALGYCEATREPIVRTATFKAPDGTEGALPVRVLLMSDLHVQAPDMVPDRLSRIVGQVNALHPDIVVIAGDFLGHNVLPTKRYTIEQAVEPLRRLKASLGVFAVPGNNDRRDAPALGYALQSVGVTYLDDDAVQVGSIALGGFRWGSFEWRRRLFRLEGLRILVAHSPDRFPRLSKGIPLMLAGHTHCGQVVLPVVGALATGSQYGTRYFCGLIRDQGNTLIVTSGLGTSLVPMRIGAPPDMWLITIE